jgi:hypothetical protein
LIDRTQNDKVKLLRFEISPLEIIFSVIHRYSFRLRIMNINVYAANHWHTRGYCKDASLLDVYVTKGLVYVDILYIVSFTYTPGHSKRKLSLRVSLRD